jgi:hypothetical protein
MKLFKKIFRNREDYCTRYCDTLHILNDMFKNIILATIHYLACMFFQCIDCVRIGAYKEVHVGEKNRIEKKIFPTYPIF